ncbi:hypothetical protein E2P81_ATG10520 [Venturia nashicola]|nr:hypothetical protein E2P81_ATG10520 [Venturia nashicola]
MSKSSDRESYTHGYDGNGVEHKTHESTPNGTPRGWDWRELAPQQNFERQLHQQQQPEILQQQYRLPLHSQAFPQSFQSGMAGDVSNLSRNDACNMPVSTPQVGTPWIKSMDQHDLGRAEDEASRHVPYAAFPGGNGQHNTGLVHPHYSTLSEPQISPGDQSRDNITKLTTPSLNYSSNARHSRRQSVSGESRARRLSQEYSVTRRVETSGSAFVAESIPSTEEEKLFYQAVMHMDDLTKYNRAAYVVSHFPSLPNFRIAQ